MKVRGVSTKVASGRGIGRFLVVVLVIAGIVTAALNLTFGGFTPVIWFLLALIILFILTCHEVFTIRSYLERRNRKGS
jgi:uncharacterized membrane protein